MDLNLPSLMTGEQLTAWAAEIAIVIGILQHLSFVPMPEGSKARAYAVVVLSIAVVFFMALGADATDLPSLIAAAVLAPQPPDAEREREESDDGEADHGHEHERAHDHGPDEHDAQHEHRDDLGQRIARAAER